MAQLGDIIVTYEQVGETCVIVHMRIGKAHHWKLYDMEELARESDRSLEDVKASILGGVKSWQQRIIISLK